jgi:cytolysin-activating lysine-acyltransferase
MNPSACAAAPALGAAPAPRPLSARDLGEVVGLLLHSPLHRGFTVADVEDWFVPPLRLGQYRFYRRGPTAVGIVTWASLDERRLATFLAGDDALARDDWRGGDRLVIVDFVAPAGGVAAMVADLRRRVFVGREAWATRRAPDGRLKRVVHYPAVDARGRRLGADATL